MQKLWPHQEKSLSMLRSSPYQRSVLVVPTGGGKSTIAAEICRRAVAQGKRVLFLAHRKELIIQAYQRIRLFGVHVATVLPGYPASNPLAPVQVASIQTLARRQHSTSIPPADIVIVDECHHTTDKNTLGNLLSNYKSARVIGLTATPERLDGKGLDSIYEDIHVASQPHDLIEDGYLIRPDIYCPPGFERTTKKKMGEYVNDEVKNKAIIGDLVSHWRSHIGVGTRSILFAASVAHSHEIVKEFSLAGVKIKHLDAKATDAERSQILSSLASGAIEVVSNVAILTEGYDLPDLDAIIMARQTASLVLYLQMAGRVMRVAKNKHKAVIMDHAGNSLEHGAPWLDREWTLQGSKKLDADSFPVRCCYNCYMMSESTLFTPMPDGKWASMCPRCMVAQCRACHGPYVPAQECPSCSSGKAGVGFIPQKESGVLVRIEERIKTTGRGPWLDALLPGPGQDTKEYRQKCYDKLVERAKSLGYSKDWVSNNYKALFGVWPRGVKKDEEWEWKQTIQKNLKRMSFE